MSTVTSCENFLLLRAAAEQLKAAATMRQLAAGYEALRVQVVEACDNARASMDRSAAQIGQQAAQGAAERARSLAALEGGSLDEMIAERDRLLVSLSRDCLRCDGYAPFDDAPCCGNRHKD